MMYLQVLVVVRLGGRGLAAYRALKRTLVRVGPHVLLEIVRPMERLATLLAAELLFRLVLPCVSHLQYENAQRQ